MKTLSARIVIRRIACMAALPAVLFGWFVLGIWPVVVISAIIAGTAVITLSRDIRSPSTRVWTKIVLIIVPIGAVLLLWGWITLQELGTLVTDVNVGFIDGLSEMGVTIHHVDATYAATLVCDTKSAWVINEQIFITTDELRRADRLSMQPKRPNFFDPEPVEPSRNKNMPDDSDVPLQPTGAVHADTQDTSDGELKSARELMETFTAYHLRRDGWGFELHSGDRIAFVRSREIGHTDSLTMPETTRSISLPRRNYPPMYPKFALSFGTATIQVIAPRYYIAQILPPPTREAGTDPRSYTFMLERGINSVTIFVQHPWLRNSIADSLGALGPHSVVLWFVLAACAVFGNVIRERIIEPFLSHLLKKYSRGPRRRAGFM